MGQNDHLTLISCPALCGVGKQREVGRWLGRFPLLPWLCPLGTLAVRGRLGIIGSLSRRRCLARIKPVFLLVAESQGYIRIIPRAKVVEFPSDLLGPPLGSVGKQGKVGGLAWQVSRRWSLA